jgi:hypothetical protein
VSDIPFTRGREVWSEVEPFLLLGRVGAAPAVPFAAAVAVMAVPPTIRAESRPPLELLPGRGVPTGSRSSADLVLHHGEVRS